MKNNLKKDVEVVTEHYKANTLNNFLTSIV